MSVLSHLLSFPSTHKESTFCDKRLPRKSSNIPLYPLRSYKLPTTQGLNNDGQCYTTKYPVTPTLDLSGSHRSPRRI
ncbi:hypothetical protein Agabi119p4_7055 [Agaricus bisporus var. burnettii]|uniref:Uncharacterized protein n=1 Tax=Agaricus bisporus var. burnettii TaxID=192524 RepID=A0A8H7F0M6_AGABI|nr:hypothetical protein Agabi119p4_7055 [Agaricus bisporus var. burnettii]